MMKILRAIALLPFILSYSHAQRKADGPAFEVASITPCKPGTPEPPGEHMGLVQFTSPGGRFTARATSVKYLLEWAYGIQSPQHAGGPAWLGTDRYDMVATAEGNPTDDQMKQMVQTLLADRFQMKLHHETEELSVYVISLGKSAPKLFAPKDGEKHSLQLAPLGGPDQKMASVRVTATRYSLAQLTDVFARQLGTVIVNQTGLDGEYDFTMDLMPDETKPNPLDAGLLINAMRDQLGLSLKYQKAAVDVLVIDNVERVVARN